MKQKHKMISKIKIKFLLSFTTVAFLSITFGRQNFNNSTKMIAKKVQSNKVLLVKKEKIEKAKRNISENYFNTDKKNVLEIVNKINNQPLLFSYEKIHFSMNKTYSKASTISEVKKILFIGDSRFVGMKESINNNTNVEFLCNSSIGYSWLAHNAIYNLQQWKEKEKTGIVVINLGINDLYNKENYMQLMENLEEKGINLYFMTLNPCDYNKMIQYGYHGIKQEEIIDFNNSLKKKFKTIDTFTYLTENGYHTLDGVHYTKDTYNKIYQYTLQYLKSY